MWCMCIYTLKDNWCVCVFYHLGLAYAAILRYGYHIRSQTIFLLHGFPLTFHARGGSQSIGAEFLIDDFPRPSPHRISTLGRFHSKLARYPQYCKMADFKPRFYLKLPPWGSHFLHGGIFFEQFYIYIYIYIYIISKLGRFQPYCKMADNKLRLIFSFGRSYTFPFRGDALPAIL